MPKATYTPIYKHEGTAYLLPELKFLYGMVPALVSQQSDCKTCFKFDLPETFTREGTWQKSLLDRLVADNSVMTMKNTFNPDIHLIKLIAVNLDISVQLINGVKQCLENVSLVPLSH